MEADSCLGVSFPHPFHSISTNYDTVTALREIRKEQNKTDLSFRKAPFKCLIREIMNGIWCGERGHREDPRIQASALGALHEAAEATIVTEFQCKFYSTRYSSFTNYGAVSNLATIHAKHVTLQQKDMQLVRSMRNIMLGYAWAGNPKQLLVSYDDLCDNPEAKKLTDQLTEPR